ncbi:c-type cytochrome [Tabrizicola sp.]|uniref:c-type cytochrome n=1 Tax=Tabrizicola sp. TaxID=2005166 RepID=UPI002734634D|nr:c-type cytochrome [Tabrizicola sp.]MDP3196319.1 c-type cytochrome [Tabrizicola sp.]
MRIIRWLVVLGLVGAGGLYVLARPNPLAAAAVSDLTGDAARGESIFWATGCASCHAADKAEGEAELVLSGGQRFTSDFGTFIAPNISQDIQHGIGDWTLLDLANAITRGVSPEGEHYYPALPYASYAKMKMQDVADLYAFMKTLPADATPSQPHELGFPFSRRETIGAWKLMFLTDDWALPGNLTPTAARGRYIAEAMAHCGECHTPRNMLGGMDTARWLGGAPNPSGEGRIPNITPGKLGWSAPDIVQYLTTGFTPDYDSVGGHMAHVVENMAWLPESDRQAVAEYLLAVPNAD